MYMTLGRVFMAASLHIALQLQSATALPPANKHIASQRERENVQLYAILKDISVHLSQKATQTFPQRKEGHLRALKNGIRFLGLLERRAIRVSEENVRAEHHHSLKGVVKPRVCFCHTSIIYLEVYKREACKCL